jgi:hypothetical protein
MSNAISLTENLATVTVGQLTFRGPEFICRNLTARLADAGTDYAGVEQIAFLTVAALANAAWMRVVKTAKHQADREFALRVIESGESIVLDSDWADLLAVLGCTPASFERVLAYWQGRDDRRVAEMARKQAEIRALWSGVVA